MNDHVSEPFRSILNNASRVLAPKSEAQVLDRLLSDVARAEDLRPEDVARVVAERPERRGE